MKEWTRKQYLEAFRMQLEMEPDEFYKAIGNLLKDGIIRFNPDKTVIKASVA